MKCVGGAKSAGYVSNRERVVTTSHPSGGFDVPSPRSSSYRVRSNVEEFQAEMGTTGRAGRGPVGSTKDKTREVVVLPFHKGEQSGAACFQRLGGGGRQNAPSSFLVRNAESAECTSPTTHLVLATKVPA
jgi:hypothetical protein